MKMSSVAVLSVLFSILIGGCNFGDGITNPNAGPSYQESLVRGLSARPYATWSPDGYEVLFCRDGDIWVMDDTGSNLDRLLLSPDENKKASHPDWQNNGITFQLDKANGSEIWSRRAFSGMAERINFDLPAGRYDQYQFPAVSPDGKYIVFSFNGQMYWCEYSLGGRAVFVDVGYEINKECQWVGMYSWAEDGRLAFVASTSEGSNIYVMSVTGAITQITFGNFKDYNPSWDKVGLRIAFDSNRFATYGQQNICLVMWDGSYLKKLTEETGEYPRFSRVNYDLLYSTQMAEGWRIVRYHKAI